jgi:hypothetical protein
MEGEISGKQSGAQVTFTTQGDVFYALDLQRPIQMRFSGPLTYKKTDMNEGMTVNLDGQGMLDYNETIQWLQVAGKPAPGAP